MAPCSKPRHEEKTTFLRFDVAATACMSTESVSANVPFPQTLTESGMRFDGELRDDAEQAKGVGGVGQTLIMVASRKGRHRSRVSLLWMQRIL